MANTKTLRSDYERGLIRKRLENLTASHYQWSGRIVSETHLHDFDLNWFEQENRMRRGGLRVAREIEEEIQDFAGVKDFVGKRLRINNIDVVEEPDWVYDLFAGGLSNG